MSIERKFQKRLQRRVFRVREKVVKNCFYSSSVRISAFRSLKHFYAQAIDDVNGVTVASCSSNGKEAEVKFKGTKLEKAHQMGQFFAAQLQEKNIVNVVFDRGSFAYHGRIKAFVEGMREKGLKI